MEAAAHIVEYTLNYELKMKLGEMGIKGLLVDFNENIHLAKINGRFIALVEAESILFKKGAFPTLSQIKRHSVMSAL